MKIIKWILALGVGGFLLFFGNLKFSGAAFIFPYIEYKASILGLPLGDLAYPLGNYLVGAVEIIAGILVILPMTRKFGSLFAVLPFLGAAVIHLTPYLGIVTPLDFADPKPISALGVGSGFVRTDFTTETGMTLFMIAVGMLVISIVNSLIQQRPD